jgi:hypothetical protein
MPMPSGPLKLAKKTLPAKDPNAVLELLPEGYEPKGLADWGDPQAANQRIPVLRCYEYQ